MVIIWVWYLDGYHRLGRGKEASVLRLILAALALMQRRRSRSALTGLKYHRVLQVSFDSRGFGGGFGLGTPVVSYAPRPMLQGDASLVIMRMLKRSQRRCACARHVDMSKGEQAAIYSV